MQKMVPRAHLGQIRYIYHRTRTEEMESISGARNFDSCSSSIPHVITQNLVSSYLYLPKVSIITVPALQIYSRMH